MQLTKRLKEFDSAVFQAIEAEHQRQSDHLELIASENYVSRAVLEAQGSVLTNKYAEGYPGKRYYGGCEHVDVVENLAQTRIKQLFSADYANVQPHSGSQANAAAYLSLMEPGDTLLGMSLSHGGHLTHGSNVNFSGKIYRSVHYGVDPQTGLLDYDAVAALAKQHRPKVIVAGFSAYSRVMDWKKFRSIADEVSAALVVDMAHVAGLIAAGIYPSPIEHAEIVTSTTHKTLRGPRGGLILARSQPDLEKRINSAVFPGLQGGPLMHVIAAKAVAFQEALQPEFKKYQQQVVRNAQVMAKTLIERGFNIVSGGTDNHLFLIDLSHHALTGKDAEIALGNANITVNKNTVPNETRSPFITSGLRIGTPAITSRGFGETECRLVADWIADILDSAAESRVLAQVREKVLELCRGFPVPGV